MSGQYEKAFLESIEHPEAFWGKAAEQIHWHKPFQQVLDQSKAPFYDWFSGGELNTCYNAVDAHVNAGRGEQTAVIYDSPVTNTITKYTYAQLLDKVAKFAGVLVNNGVVKGDRVIIYMPMIPETVIAMLACARIGAVHSVVFGGFAPQELAVRINDAQPKLILSASCGIEGARVIEYKPLLDRAMDLATYKPDKCIIFQRPQVRSNLFEGRDLDWAEQEQHAEHVGCTMVKSTDPLYILYTSGTTGIPKGIVRDNGGHAVALKWTMKNIYNVEPGDVFWAGSDVGWVVGHSYIVYAPLLYGCTTVLYEGKPIGTPDPGAFWRVISQHNVKVLFCAPTVLRAIKKEDPNGEYLKKYDLAGFKYLFQAGERLDPDTYHWASNLLKVPVIDHWWQTETGWAVASNCVGLELLPIKAGSPTKPVPGYQVVVMDEEGQVLPRGKEGTIAIKLPLPPGNLTTLWQNDQKYKESYLEHYPGFYLTGDGGYFDQDGYIYIMGRIDDVINVAGHRLSTGAMEEILASHDEVAECAVIGVADGLRGEIPLGFVVLKNGVTKAPGIIVQELISMVRDRIGAFAYLRNVAVVKRLPKTRSGKILRSTMRKIADSQAYVVPPTIDDPVILGEITSSLQTIGYAAGTQR
ncbi:MAG: propionyl-CoA synthetase [Dehalogenimonas sp.]|uniref:Propionyl-CoA synthetase n=1 Tax=Candidatus Dehalogenimonas loeffleri TaxID=3127115 RepID=A0ABZ2J4U1_9CHLR|nr:propionyl-CoA synthetase [Dehalogenimonas sp.]